jgi:ribonuclease T1
MSPAILFALTSRLRGFLVAALAIIFVLGTGTIPPPFSGAGETLADGQEAAERSSVGDSRDSTAPDQPPQKARDLLAVLKERHGMPLPGYIGGRDFKNRERRLPSGRYREYDVNPKIRGRPRDAERIVIDQRTGKAYYTPDHYRTFAPLN